MGQSALGGMLARRRVCRALRVRHVARALRGLPLPWHVVVLVARHAVPEPDARLLRRAHALAFELRNPARRETFEMDF